ncbi:dipeptidase 1 [Condylostylus longicornis]|uniref:dipeptidase 1 n=1 Tax=Condylostylus longicornis TaxID=2530218 RepID=UPI00244E2B08|nr:dipeptidase 1 [Condylostylus longicornis]
MGDENTIFSLVAKTVETEKNSTYRLAQSNKFSYFETEDQENQWSNKMNPVPNHDFMELPTVHHQHQPHCKQRCFVFTEIADIELPPEITLTNKYSTEKLKSASIQSYKMENSITPIPENSSKGPKVVAILSAILVCICLAGGIPLALQLRASSLLEARLSFIRRLLSETPLVEGYWYPKKDVNLTVSINEVKSNLVGAVLWPITVPCEAQYLDAVQLALEGIDEARRMLSKSQTAMKIVETADEMQAAHSDGQVAVLLGLAGGHTLGASLAVLRSMYMLSARFVSITSLGCTTPWAGASIRNDRIIEENSTNTLTEFGKSILFEMNRLGMLVEISQLSEQAMEIAIKTAKAPVLLSNAAPLSLCNSSNLASIPDHILGLLSDNGGVIMLNMEKCGERQLTVREAIYAINYVRKIAGVDHIGLSGAPNSYTYLLAELARDRVWGNAAIKKLVGGNIVRILREIETLKNRLPLYENWIPHELIESKSYCRYPES